jgi:hypothetical protein
LAVECLADALCSGELNGPKFLQTQHSVGIDSTSVRTVPGSKVGPEREANNLAAICEPTV